MISITSTLSGVTARSRITGVSSLLGVDPNRDRVEGKNSGAIDRFRTGVSDLANMGCTLAGVVLLGLGLDALAADPEVPVRRDEGPVRRDRLWQSSSESEESSIGSGTTVNWLSFRFAGDGVRVTGC
jgi:hypothetical protein